MIFFDLSSAWLSGFYITQNCAFCGGTTAEKQKLDFFNHFSFEAAILNQETIMLHLFLLLTALAAQQYCLSGEL